MKPILETLTVVPFDENTYLVGDADAGQAVVVDPGGRVDDIVRLAERHGVDVPIAREVHAVLYEGKAVRTSIVALLALALEKLGRDEEALQTLTRSLDLARPGGWIRPFVEAGPAMADMLETDIRQIDKALAGAAD